MDLKILKFILSNFAGHFAILLNAILIWLIKTKSGVVLANYRKILYLGAIFDLIFASLTAFLQPQVIGVAEYYFVAIEGWISYIGHPIAYWAQMTVIYLTYASMTIACVQFIYRFFIICCNITLDWKAFTGLIIVALAIPLYLFLSFCLPLNPGYDNFDHYAALLASSGMTLNPAPKIFIVTLVMNMLKSETVSTLISWGSQIVMLFCSTAVILRLWIHKKKFQLGDRKIQNQLTIVLFCEQAVPLFTVILPVQLLSLRQFPWFPTMFSFIIGFSPLFNPIVKMFVISPFRKYIFRTILRRKDASSSIVITVASSNENKEKSDKLIFTRSNDFQNNEPKKYCEKKDVFEFKGGRRSGDGQ